ncbi:MAG: hypothetical protein J3Q66DRAFT_333923 [Benniella sp.]|nr:MAG: hypothetical protein J3Q66DRAFT_333923 [Benniella sp.]
MRFQLAVVPLLMGLGAVAASVALTEEKPVRLAIEPFAGLLDNLGGLTGDKPILKLEPDPTPTPTTTRNRKVSSATPTTKPKPKEEAPKPLLGGLLGGGGSSSKDDEEDKGGEPKKNSKPLLGGLLGGGSNDDDKEDKDEKKPKPLLGGLLGGSDDDDKEDKDEKKSKPLLGGLLGGSDDDDKEDKDEKKKPKPLLGDLLGGGKDDKEDKDEKKKPKGGLDLDLGLGGKDPLLKVSVGPKPTPTPKPKKKPTQPKPKPKPKPVPIIGISIGLPGPDETTTVDVPAPTDPERLTPTTTADSSQPTETAAPTITTPPEPTITSPPVGPPTTNHPPRPPRTTTDPWLPTTIVPLAPTQTPTPPSPGASLPEVVIPDLQPKIPDNSFNVVLRFQHVSYFQVIHNSVLAAQLVSFIPAQLGEVLNIDPQLILVLAIRDGSGSSNGGAKAQAVTEGRQVRSTKRKRAVVTTNSNEDAILVTVAIPRDQYWALSAMVKDPSSPLYTPGADSFGQYLDPTYDLSKNPPSSDGDKGKGNGKDNTPPNPLTGHNNPGQITHPDSAGGSSSPSKAPLIGSVIGLVTVAYVGIAIIVIRRYRHKKLKEQERGTTMRNISAPISVQATTAHGW